MNVIKSNWLSSLLILIAGVALCCLYERANTINIIIYIIGALFTSTGCINIISISMSHNGGKASAATTIIGWIAGLAGIGLGAAMLITQATFHKIIIYVFGIVLLCAALWHIFLLAYYYRSYKLPFWLYISPLLLIIGGILILCSADIRTRVTPAILITGIGAIIFAVTTLLEFIVAKEKKKENDKEVAQEEEVKKDENVNTVRGKTLTESIKDAVTIPEPETEERPETKE